MSIGSNIKKLRESKDMTQEELAEKIGVTRSAVTQWESGWSNPKMGNIEALATFFCVDKSTLIEDAKKKDQASSLDADEERLLYMYRDMTNAGRAALMATAEGLHSTYRIKNNQVSTKSA